eukprot:CAMPEP_0184654584 /NCGR_PEP_ID=MMETSP0308-20130426/12220_1 /TAXON_ID=38269 /ORGANISM="Gloeochaete witrockiana, Strain SAG 46.84" /LENGTH=208 /DNA_ID=CAMNT_0027090629 /DNA_START=140 /DNA_END=763 /DNA_ORIENTATION=+
MIRLFLLFLFATPLLAVSSHEYEGKQIHTWPGPGTNPWFVKFSTGLNSGYYGPTVRLTYRYLQPSQPVVGFFPRATSVDLTLPSPKVWYNNDTRPWPFGNGIAAYDLVLPQNVVLHPGPNGEAAHFVFNVPATAEYAIQADFFAIARLANVVAHMLVNGVEFWTSDVSGGGGQTAFVPHRISTKLTLRQNSFVDFVVDCPPGGDSAGW